MGTLAAIFKASNGSISTSVIFVCADLLNILTVLQMPHSEPPPGKTSSLVNDQHEGMYLSPVSCNSVI